MSEPPTPRTDIWLAGPAEGTEQHIALALLGRRGQVAGLGRERARDGPGKGGADEPTRSAIGVGFVNTGRSAKEGSHR
jgi:hypothetical protein